MKELVQQSFFTSSCLTVASSGTVMELRLTPQHARLHPDTNLPFSSCCTRLLRRSRRGYDGWRPGADMARFGAADDVEEEEDVRLNPGARYRALLTLFCKK